MGLLSFPRQKRPAAATTHTHDDSTRPRPRSTSTARLSRPRRKSCSVADSAALIAFDEPPPLPAFRPRTMSLPRADADDDDARPTLVFDTRSYTPSTTNVPPLPPMPVSTVALAETHLRQRPRSSRRPMSNYTCELPPGAAEPVIFDRDALRAANAVVHGRSVSLPAAETMLAVRKPAHAVSQIMSPNATPMGPPPAVPPRSRLRALHATPVNLDAKLPVVASAETLARATIATRPFVLDVAPAAEPSDVSDDEEPVTEVIRFRPVHRKRSSMSSSVDLDSRDPYKIRDGREPRKASSGVYTPRTFAGPLGSQPSSPGPSSPTTPTSPGSVTRLAPSLHGRTLSGFKRLSSAIATSYAGGSYTGSTPMMPSISSPMPARTSSLNATAPASSGSVSQFGALSQRASYSTMPSRPPLPTLVTSPVSTREHSTLGSSSMSTPSLSSNGHSGSGHSRSVSQHVSRPSYSHSASSASPPGTPTTPTSLGAHSPGSVGMGIIASDDGHKRLSVEDAEVAAKATRTRAEPPAPLSLASPPAIPAACPTTPVSPGAPKRARRKPVPRLEDDLVQRLQELEAN